MNSAPSLETYLPLHLVVALVQGFKLKFKVFIFYCLYMCSVLMSSQPKMHEGWSHLQVSGQWKGPSIYSSIYGQVCSVEN